ncbi:MAG: hypothetical protein ACRYFL_14605 [Janthinobacterium lividum]
MNKKNQKSKNAGSPLGGIQSHAPGWLSCIRLCLVLNLLKHASFINIFSTLFIELFRAACKVTHPGVVGRQNARRDRVCLDFLVLFNQAKRTTKKANSPFEHSFMLLKEAQ